VLSLKNDVEIMSLMLRDNTIFALGTILAIYP
jgi:hypothetical protein